MISIYVKYDKYADIWVSHVPTFDIYSQGTTESKAYEAAKDAVNHYLIVAGRLKLFSRILKFHKINAQMAKRQTRLPQK